MISDSNNNFNRCVIITAYLQGSIKDCLHLNNDDYIICVDGGYDLALAENISPHIVIGDFDSSSKNSPVFSISAYDSSHTTTYDGSHKENNSPEIVRLPVEKDDTDTMMALKHGIHMGFTNIILIGGVGGRLDHTIANLQALSYFLDHAPLGDSVDIPKPSIWLLGKKNKVTLIQSQKIIIGDQFPLRRDDSKLSLLSFTQQCTGITISGVKYPLKNATLTQSFPLGVSNEVLEGSVAKVSVDQGKLLVILSTD